MGYLKFDVGLFIVCVTSFRLTQAVIAMAWQVNRAAQKEKDPWTLRALPDVLSKLV